MKRHSALVPLSRDHHHALVIAQQLKRANRVTGRRVQAAFLDYWDRDGQRHFREEEELLLPRCVGHLDIEQPLVAKLLTDHIAIRHLATELAAPGTSESERLHEL